MSLQNTLKEAVKVIPECLAAGYVDISTGLLLGVNTVNSHPSSVLELVAAATADMFAGKNVTQIENLFKKSRGVTSQNHYFKEIIVNSDNLIHVFIRGANENRVGVFVCNNSAMLGMVLNGARQVMPHIEESATMKVELSTPTSTSASIVL